MEAEEEWPPPGHSGMAVVVVCLSIKRRYITVVFYDYRRCRLLAARAGAAYNLAGKGSRGSHISVRLRSDSILPYQDRPAAQRIPSALVVVALGLCEYTPCRVQHRALSVRPSSWAPLLLSSSLALAGWCWWGRRRADSQAKFTPMAMTRRGRTRPWLDGQCRRRGAAAGPLVERRPHTLSLSAGLVYAGWAGLVSPQLDLRLCGERTCLSFQLPQKFFFASFCVKYKKKRTDSDNLCWTNMLGLETTSSTTTSSSSPITTTSMASQYIQPDYLSPLSSTVRADAASCFG